MGTGNSEIAIYIYSYIRCGVDGSSSVAHYYNNNERIRPFLHVIMLKMLYDVYVWDCARRERVKHEIIICSKHKANANHVNDERVMREREWKIRTIKSNARRNGASTTSTVYDV